PGSGRGSGRRQEITSQVGRIGIPSHGTSEDLMRTQDVRTAGTVLLFLLLVASGCQRARQYGGPPKAAKSSPSANDDLKVPEPSYHVWRESKKESWDIPIVFVPATAAEWADLPHFWNLMPRFGAAAPVAFLGTSPL